MLEQERQPAGGQTTAHARMSGYLATMPWVWRLASLGFAAKGVLYVIAGSTVALAAVQVGGRVIGTRGALTLLVALPLGRLTVAVVAIGLCGFILRRFVQVLVPPTDGTPPRFMITRVLRRTGYALSGIADIGIALTALGLALGLTIVRPAPRMPGRGWTIQLLMDRPLNGWLTLCAGLVVVGVAGFYFYMAVRRRFTIDLYVDRIRPRMRRVMVVCGIVGYAGRGVAFLIVGVFLVYAGWFVEDVEARGLSDLLRTLEVQTSGRWLLVAVAVGLIAYGVYLLLAARYLRLVATW